MRAGGSASLASRAGSDSRMMAWAATPAGTARRPQMTIVAATAPRRSRARIASAPVVEHQIVRALVVVLLAFLHAHHGEVRMVSALEQTLVGGPVVRVHGRHHALELRGMRHLLDRRQQGVEVLGLPVVRLYGEELDVDAAVGRLAHARHVHDGKADHIPPLFEEQGVAEGETVYDLDLLAEVHATVERLGDATHPLHGGLLLRLLQRGVPADAEAGLGGARR